MHCIGRITSYLNPPSRVAILSKLMKCELSTRRYSEYIASMSTQAAFISYGVNLDWCFHRAAYFVDRILKGAKAADLPVKFPTTLEL
jgi:hypothetical protein